MKKKRRKNKTSNGTSLIVPIILIFCILSTMVYYVAKRISSEISESAINNLSESLELIKETIETILEKEVEFQKLIAQELSIVDNLEEFIYAYKVNKTMVKMSIILSGEIKGISNTGEEFSEEDLDFSEDNTIDGLPISKSYLNDMGTWAYTIKCPIVKNNEEIAVLYIEYIYDSLDNAIPEKFYNDNAMFCIVDAKSENLVLKTKEIEEDLTEYLNLADFYYVNRVLGDDIHSEVSKCIQAGENIMFYYNIQNKESLVYMWAINGGSIYLIGYIPIETIQQDRDVVNQNIFILIFSMLVAFLVCCILYYLSKRQQNKIRKEQEIERELHNNQLTEALKVAQIANKSKTMFLSNMSHDIRTPMNAILGFTTLLAKDENNPIKVREYTKKITASSQHLLSLINDVLDVSKIESGKAVLNIGEFTLNDIISSVDTIIRPMAKEKRQEFDIIVIGIKHEHLIGDETRINQVLINLLSNSVKYTQKGGNIWLRIIGLEEHSNQHEHIRIEVEDNGYGMTQEYLAIIFDAFTRAENDTTNKVEGTGLGMAITKSIVELMGGTIGVTSEVDKGSFFTVELELRITDEKEDKQFWKKNGIFRILVINDDENICKNIQMLLNDVGVLVDISLNGKDALRLIYDTYSQGSNYDVILIDWKMPNVDAIQIARQIKSIISDNVPILFLMGYDWEDIEEEAIQAGIDGFLSKPFFISTFKEKIVEVNTKQKNDNNIEVLKSSIKGRHFLIAEDNEINSEILLELLNLDGATGEVVENGKLALECFQNSPPEKFDAILMDVQMPVMNGYDATRAIRALEREDAKTIPIIAMTANAFLEDVKDARDAGMNDHIAKPIDMEIVRKILTKYLKKKK